MEGLGMLIGAGINLATDDVAANRQYSMQKQLNAQQQQAAQENAKYEQQLAYDMWEKTNYAAQRQQMEKAGLNVGLMYNKGGQGGSTQGAGKVAGPNAGSAPLINTTGQGMAMGMAAQAQMAQIELTKAQTENVKADTATKEGIPAVNEASRQKTLAETSNEVLRGTTIELDNELKRIEKYVKDNSASDSIAMIGAALNRARGEAESAQASGKVDQATVNESIQIMQQTAAEQQVRIAAGKMGIKVDEAQIKSISTNIAKTMQDNQREWENMSYKDRELRIKQKAQEIAQQQVEFNTGGAAQTKQWADIVQQIMRQIH